MTWESLLLVRKYLLYVGCFGHIYTEDNLKISIPDPSAVFAGLDYDLDLSKGPKALQQVLYSLRGNKASDPRDYIYGIRSLLSDDIRGKLAVE